MKCWVCYGGIGECVCDRAANDHTQANADFLRMPADQSLARQSSLHRLSMAYVAMGRSRRTVLDFLNDQFISYRGIVVDERGRRIDLLGIEVDEVFRTDNDPSERWLSDFMQFASGMPCRRAQDRVLPRLRLLWLALAIRFPTQAEHVVR